MSDNDESGRSHDIGADALKTDSTSIALPAMQETSSSEASPTQIDEESDSDSETESEYFICLDAYKLGQQVGRATRSASLSPNVQGLGPVFWR